jgi:uncharacterized protein (UPF0276 family)
MTNLYTGLGLRRDMFQEESFFSLDSSDIDFLEIAPENWIDIGGEYKEKLKYFSQKFPITLHGLSLSIGSYDDLDFELLKNIKKMIKEYNIKYYTEHLSFCSNNGHMYDLMPLPFNEETINHISKRIKIVQDFLELTISLENISYYYEHEENDLKEYEFINGILRKSNCNLLLDVNNAYVNSINHKYNPYDFIDNLDLDKINYLHVAGHYNESDNLKIDTHGSDVIFEVWELLKYTYSKIGIKPTLLERDFNIPNANILLKEIHKIKEIQHDSKNSRKF